MMIAFDEFLRRLGEAPPTPSEWEKIYEREQVDVDRDEIYEVGNSRRVYAEWLVMRFDAGPPGVPLPSHKEALQGILSGVDGTARDAYRTVFSGPLPEEFPADLIIALLHNAAMCALKAGGTWFATWLGARAGLASIALGAPERAWQLLDIHSHGDRHGNLDKLAIFEPIRGHIALEINPFVQGAIWRLWPELDVPAVPNLPHPKFPDDAPTLEETVEALNKIDAHQVRGFIESFAEAKFQWAVDERTDHPLVKKLIEAAIVPGADAPEVDPDEVPTWFVDWAKAVGHRRYHEPHLARRVGLVLHRLSLGAPELAALLILPAVRSADLEVIENCLPDLQQLTQDLRAASDVLPEQLADVLVAAVLDRHVNQPWAIAEFERRIDEFAEIEPIPGGIVEHYIATARDAVNQRSLVQTDAREDFDKLIRSVSRVAARFDEGARILENEIERALTSVELPPLRLELLDLALQSGRDLEPQVRLVLALALHRAVQDDDGRVLFAKEASDAIFELNAVELFELRLGLLNECIEAEHPWLSLAELHYKRSNTWQRSAPDDPRMIQLAIADMRRAMELARAESAPEMRAGATAAWVRFLTISQGHGLEIDIDLDRVRKVIDEALTLPIAPHQKAVVQQALAHFLRRSDPHEAASVFSQALEMADKESPFYAELAAEYVTTLVRASRIDEAMRHGVKALETVSCSEDALELGMLYLAAGEAFFAAGRPKEAQTYLEGGLRLVRGREGISHNEMHAHVQLARVGLVCKNEDLLAEELRFLRDHRHELNHQLECDFLKMEAAAARQRGEPKEARAALYELLSHSRDEAQRRQARFELAGLDTVARKTSSPTKAPLSVASATSADKQRDVTDLAPEHDHASMMADAALELAELSLRADTPSEVSAQLEDAWTALREVDAYLLYDSARREREAQVALNAAFQLAQTYADQVGPAEEAGLSFVLSGDRAEVVAGWVLRSHEPARRLMRARLSPPAGVSAKLRQDWLTAIDNGNRTETVQLLDQIRETDPSFPVRDGYIEATWQWLSAELGSLGLTVILGEEFSLAVLLQVDSDGRRRRWVLGLDIPTPPLALDALAQQMAGSVPDGNAAASHDRMVAWFREYAIEPIVDFLGQAPSKVLWCPGPGLRSISPAALWPNTAVATTASLSLPRHDSGPGRRSSSLIFLADPGPDVEEGRFDLRGHGKPAARELATVAESRANRVRYLASVGACYGRDLLGEHEGVRNTPASAGDLLREVVHHDVLVLIAHGEAKSAETAALLCVNEHGEVERLDVPKLQQEPDSFAGATVVLLSCESGRVGNSLTEPGGVAGTLISAGARCVVAPLWAVKLNVAKAVGKDVLRGLAEGLEPWEALLQVQSAEAGESPSLGRLPPSPQQVEAAEHLQRTAFVTWVG